MLKLAPLVLAAVLAGCSSGGRLAESLNTDPNSGPCPVIGSVYDVSRFVKFADADGKLYSDIAYTGEITDVRLFCRYTGKAPLVAEVEIDFAFGKGPMGTANSAAYPYFVAVTRRNGKVLAKEYFNTEADFGRGAVAGKTELVSRITIPRADESISGVNFEIVVGFDLTDEQLAFNRAGNRFRLDAGN
jgi:hypothetical protein